MTLSRRVKRSIIGAMVGAHPDTALTRHCWRVVLITAVVLSFDHSTMLAAGARTGQWVTPLSWLPDAWIFSDVVMVTCHVVFLVAVALWVMRRAIPYSSWAAALAMTLFVSIYHERRFYVDHIFQMINVSLWILAWWAHIARVKWQRRGEPLLLPTWVVTAHAAILGLFYSLSGVAKLSSAGVGWANGVSLQAWVHLWGRPPWLVEWLTHHRGVAAAMQATTLAAELLALPALLHRRSRWVIGAVLLGFHAGQQLIFGWEFYGNMVLLGLFYLPVCALLAERAGATS